MHPKLGRIPSPYDVRSEAFGLRRLLSDYQTLNWITKTWDCPIQLNQLDQPSCVGNGHAHCLASMPVEDLGVTEDVALQIYHTAQALDGIPGEHEGSTVLAGAKAVQQLWPTAYGSYNWGYGINDTLSALSHIGPCVLGIDWYESMFTPDEQAVIRPTGSVAGGHCILAIGLDTTAKTVTLKNSWGSNWGINGCCYIGWDDLSKLLSENGECVVPLNRSLITV